MLPSFRSRRGGASNNGMSIERPLCTRHSIVHGTEGKRPREPEIQKRKKCARTYLSPRRDSASCTIRAELQACLSARSFKPRIWKDCDPFVPFAAKSGRGSSSPIRDISRDETRSGLGRIADEGATRARNASAYRISQAANEPHAALGTIKILKIVCDTNTTMGTHSDTAWMRTLAARS
jgi:hypothetical protein